MWWRSVKGHDTRNALSDSGWGFHQELDSVRDRLGKCVILSSSNGIPVTEGRRAFAFDYDEYGADLITFDDFGCVEHQTGKDLA
jgi:hypothetical protein